MERQQRYRKHPEGVDLYFYVPHKGAKGKEAADTGHVPKQKRFEV